jgi:hypothetical protein
MNNSINYLYLLNKLGKVVFFAAKPHKKPTLLFIEKIQLFLGVFFLARLRAKKHPEEIFRIVT